MPTTHNPLPKQPANNNMPRTPTTRFFRRQRKLSPATSGATAVVADDDGALALNAEGSPPQAEDEAEAEGGLGAGGGGDGGDLGGAVAVAQAVGGLGGAQYQAFLAANPAFLTAVETALAGRFAGRITDLEEENKGLKGDIKSLADENLTLSKYATFLEKEQSEIFEHFTRECNGLTEHFTKQCDGVRGLVTDGLTMQGERIVRAEVRIGRVESRQQGGH